MTKDADTASNVVQLKRPEAEDTDAEKLTLKRFKVRSVAADAPDEATLDAMLAAGGAEPATLLAFPEPGPPDEGPAIRNLALSLIGFLIDNIAGLELDRLELARKILDREQTPDVLIQRIKKTGRKQWLNDADGRTEGK